MIPVMTIDGPGGAGKGTVSRAVASRLGWHYLDSGAIYRALAIFALNNALPLEDHAAISDAAQQLELSFSTAEDRIVLLAGKDITAQLQTDACGQVASKIATYPSVRHALLLRQRSLCQDPGLVADGRDMGTVVFPDASCKIFLTASARTRAERRYKQLKDQGYDVNFDSLFRELIERDRRDSERVEAPMRPARDAILIDSSTLTIDQVIDQCLHVVQPYVIKPVLP